MKGLGNIANSGAFSFIDACEKTTHAYEQSLIPSSLLSLPLIQFTCNAIKYSN